MREAGLALVAAAVVVLLFAVFGDTAVLRGLETASLDLRFRIRGVRAPGQEIAVILVDDRSLAALGRWPFSRHLFAKALGALKGEGAKLVVFDLLFAEPDELVPASLRAAAQSAAAALSGKESASLRAALERLAADDPDEEFAAAIRTSGNVLLPVGFALTGPPGTEPAYLSDAAYARFDKSPLEPIFPLRPVSALPPIPMLAKAALGLGHVNIAYDRDGAPRYDYLALPFEADFLPSMSVRAAAAYLGVPWQDVGLALGEGVRIGETVVPTDPAMRLLINYRGPRGTFPTFSFVDLVEGRIPAPALRGRVALIGASFIGSSDTFPAPFGITQLPGVERMANIIDSILARDFIADDPPPWPALVAIAVLLLAALTGATMAVLPTRGAVLAGSAPLAAWAAAAQLAFLHGLWLPLVGPLAALAAASLAVLLFRYWVVDRDGRRIRSAFRHYLAPDMVNVLAAHPERLQLGGELREMTFLFCDVRGFTSISEQFKANPQGLTHLINRFLTPMTDIIMAERGTIDKYMGDCIMAFWNAPLEDADHADHACASALAMVRELEGVNARLAAEAAAEKRPFYPLKLGVGLNSGDCVVGNMGSDQRFDYSVLGDAVNLASRLEGQSKTYGVDIVMGETTRRKAPSWAALELDLIAVKGKKEAVRIFALLGDGTTAQAPEFRALVERHDAMLAAYRAQDWARARAALGESARLGTRLAHLYELYEERISHYVAHPPGRDWDGVFIATSK